MLMLILVSLLSGIVLMAVGYDRGRKAIQQSVFEKLTAIRIAKKYQVEVYFREIFELTEILGQTDNIATALTEFKQAYDSLQVSVSPSDCAPLRPFYQQFAFETAENLGVTDNTDFYIPQSSVSCHLQERYLLSESVTQTDLSVYETVHERHHWYLSNIIKKFGFYDLFLIDLKTGEVVYTVEKETDFATNLYTGPYQTSNLADLARQLRDNPDLTGSVPVDFKKYRPSEGEPAAFIGIPVRNGTEVLGALALQIDSDDRNDIMTDNQQ